MDVGKSIRGCFVFLGIAWAALGLSAGTHAAELINGPYLLAPTPTGMTVSFETRAAIPAKLIYSANGGPAATIEVACERGAPWKGNPQGDCLYRAALSELRPATRYDYTVVLASGEKHTGTFRTLREGSNELHLYTISDSHGFKGSPLLAEAVLRDRPDFILHTGDLPAGTGFQKDKYQESWFGPGAEFLRHIPVVYINGNHDAGPHFEHYFMKAQRQAYRASPNGMNFAFEAGPAHIAMVNSNAWGLSEMNADLSDLPVDPKALTEIQGTLTWLQDDLRSTPASAATWRIVGMHHPYTEQFSNKRVTSILENNDVNLMLGGHLHAYQKSISMDPARAARTLFITQGTAEGAHGEMNYGTPDERIFPELPEVLAFGRTIFGKIDITGDEMRYSVHGQPKGENAVRLLDETVLTRDAPRLALNKVTLTPVKGSPGTIVFEGEVRNDGRGFAGVVIPLQDNGHAVPLNLFGTPGKERVVGLAPGETKRVRKTITLASQGKHELSIGSTRTTVQVPTPTAKTLLSGLTIRVGQGEDSNQAIIQVEVSNPHAKAVEDRLELRIDGRVVATQPVSLRANEMSTRQLTHRFPFGGQYAIRVGDLPAKTIVIEGTLKGTPLVTDRSGHGNHAILRGNPKVTRQDDGTVSVDLAGSLGDYIEIPDHPSLRVKDGVSGLVWANLNRLPIAGEADRNPIMVKGPSIGWGANYLVRMLVKRSGGTFSAGICYDTSEHYWESSGKAPLAQWAQYAMAFDARRGGASYVDARKVGEIAPLDDYTEFRNWEGHPIFIGYSRLGNIVKELKRPRNFAHFVGQVSQVRFYTTGLSSEEIQAIKDQPGAVGPHADKLAAWLDFSDIRTAGRHETPWQRPAHFQPAYRADKQLWSYRTLQAKTRMPPGTSLTATIEVSDDRTTVKGAKQVQLRDGEQRIDLADLPPGQYLRIVSRFDSVVGPDGIVVPELHHYQVRARFGDKLADLTWGTRADWEKGSFEGALGFEPPDRLVTIDGGPAVRH